MSSRKDLTGNVYGKLTVREMMYGVVRFGRKRTLCACLCECGSTCEVVADRLTSGSKTSCGCDAAQRRSESNRVDLTGKTFGSLTVLQMQWDVRPTRTICKCSCGNFANVRSAQLTSGKTTSCGHNQRDATSRANTKNWTGVVSRFGVEFISQDYKNSAGQWVWACRCGICGSRFSALPAKVMNGHITSCGCRRRSSKEEMIKSILDSMNVNYIEQYRFENCKNRYTLPFDFAIMDGDRVLLLIEYDGKQHSEPVEIFGGSNGYRETVSRDLIKDSYCKENKINLLRLPYTLTDREIEQKISNAIYP